MRSSTDRSTHPANCSAISGLDDHTVTGRAAIRHTATVTISDANTVTAAHTIAVTSPVAVPISVPAHCRMSTRRSALMPALARVERDRWSLLTGVMGLLLAVACISVALAVVAHIDANDARHVAKREAVALNEITGALREQCAQQLVAQARLRDLEQADVELQRGLITADARNLLITGGVRAARRAVYERKLRRDTEFLATPPPQPQVCAVFDQPLPVAFRSIG